MRAGDVHRGEGNIDILAILTSICRQVFVSGWSERERRELPTDTEVGDQDGWLRELGYEEMPEICMDGM